jgi:hypothetical protein
LELFQPIEGIGIIPCPKPSVTALVDSSIILLSKILPYQPLEIQSSLLEHLHRPIKAGKPNEKLPLKKIAYYLNVVSILYLVLKYISDSRKWKEGSLNLSGNVALEIQTVLQVSL